MSYMQMYRYGFTFANIQYRHYLYNLSTYFHSRYASQKFTDKIAPIRTSMSESIDFRS